MITVLKGDLVGLGLDLVVNEANTELLPRAGICRRIFEAAGPGLVRACHEAGRREFGDVVITGGYNLDCARIVHAVTPLYMDGYRGEDEDLRACYWNSLCRAYDYLRMSGKERVTIGFPLLGSGVFGFELREAAWIARKTIDRLMRRYPEAKAIDIVMVAQNDAEYAAMKEAFR